MSQYYPGKYPANFTRIPDSAGCLYFTGCRIVLSAPGTSLRTTTHADSIRVKVHTIPFLEKQNNSITQDIVLQLNH